MDTNPDTSGRYHSDWLSMMLSRLLIARSVLGEDGVIFISIDDTELHNLRKLLDDVFGEENFLATLPRRVKTGGGSAAHYFAIEHDYVVVYAKNKAKLPPLFIPHDEEYIKRYSEEDEDGRYFWDTMERSYTQTKPYKIKAPDGQLLEGNWFRSEDRFHEDLEKGEVRFLKKDNGSWSVQFKQRLGPGRKLRSLLHQNTFKSTHDEIDELGLEGAFSFPKPTSLIKILIQATCPPDSPSIVLDFFAGSGTTGQAVLELNEEEYEGNLQFILVQLPEAIDEEHSAFKAGFRTISEITIERCKRVIQGYGNDPQPLDTGFKVYRLTKSHFPRVEFQPDPDKTAEENVELLQRYIAAKESGFQITFDQDKVFDEVLLKHGFKLDYSLTEVDEIEENLVYTADDGTRQALICLDIAISDAIVDYFKDHTDKPFICLERALDTTKKWNLKHFLGDRLKSI